MICVRGEGWVGPFRRKPIRVRKHMGLILGPLARLLGVAGEGKRKEFWIFKPTEVRADAMVATEK
jgi:hypothetical protein